MPGLFWRLGRNEADRLAAMPVPTEDFDHIRTQLLPGEQNPTFDPALAPGQATIPGETT
jgi:hypothetical protein